MEPTLGAGLRTLRGVADDLLSRPPRRGREWELAEEEHFERDRPWTRADLLVTNDPPAPPAPEQQLRIIGTASWRVEDRPA